MQVNLNSPPAPHLSCWVLTEGMVGTENQCLGIAEALDVTPEIHRIALRQPWKSLSPWLGFECASTFVPALHGPWPDILIASGRKSIAASRYIKKASGGKTFTVQVQDPRISPRHFDLVSVPFHDPTRGENVIVTDGAPNRIRQDKLDAARAQFAPLFGPLPGPRVAVLIGGTSKAYTMTPAIAAALGTQLKAVYDASGAGLMITASRRTGEDNTAALKEALGDTPHYFWDGRGDNPYPGMLAWADAVLVTADSVSMLSEAATTGKPVYIIPLDGGQPRLQTFHRHMMDMGIARTFAGHLEHWTYPALDDAGKVAQAIRARMKHL